MTEYINEHTGTFITFEGGEGVGKSTHISFLAEVLESQGYEVLCVREPGGTNIGEQLRQLVLDPDNEEMSDEAELLIYEAARAQIVREVIAPALERGVIVLCDRFYDSTVAYQAFGRGLSREFVEQANSFACQGIHPQRTIVMVCGDDVKMGLARATHHGEADRLERAGETFHERVNAGFAYIVEKNPERVKVVESTQKKSDTAKAIFSQLSDIFPWMLDESLVNNDLFTKVDTMYYGNKKPAKENTPLVFSDDLLKANVHNG